MAKVIINDTNYEFEEIIGAGVENISFSAEEDIEIITFKLKENILDHLYYKVNLNTFGGIAVAYSDDGINWTYESNHATALSYGAVKISDSSSATGTAANGLVPSQKALSDGLKSLTTPTDITSSVSKINTSEFTVDEYSVCRCGSVVEVYAMVRRTSGTTVKGFLSGLPAAFKPFTYRCRSGNDESFAVGVTSAGNVVMTSAGTVSRTEIQFTYLAAD